MTQFCTVAACHARAMSSPREGESRCVYPRFTSYPQGAIMLIVNVTAIAVAFLAGNALAHQNGVFVPLAIISVALICLGRP